MTTLQHPGVLDIPVEDAMNAGMCTLEFAVGRATDCPGRRCPFWEAEHATGCVIEPIRSQIVNTPELAQLLLELRTTLIRAQLTSENEASREFLCRRLHTG